MNDVEQESIDITKLRYALYVRKSTDDKERQQRSVDDQIAECEELAAKLGINLVKPYYRDDGSAKIANNPKRRRFYELLTDLRTNKIDGIMSWHPDRLARNMQDGGEIFGLIDDHLLKDLKFVTHYFTNDASGKMLLGISFTLSTYYSANLSQNVKRGHRRAFKEGKSSGTPKHGYVRTDDATYQPDGKNYELVVEAWQLRKNGTGLREIADYVNEQGYGRKVKDSKSKRYGQKITMTYQILSEMFKDPFYYGVLIQTNKTVNLCDAYDFKTAVSEEDFNEVQRLSRAIKLPLVANRRMTFYPLRNMVKCSLCMRSMSPAASKARSGTQYLYYRCTNESCTRKPKSIRAKVIFNFIYDLLKDGIELTEKDYKVYYEGLTTQSDAEHLRMKTEINSKLGALKDTKRRIDTISKKIIDYDKNSRVWKVNNERLIELEKDEKDLQNQIKELQDVQSDPKKDILTIEQFLNLAQNAGSKVKAANEIGKDHISRIIFLNLVVNEEKVVSYQMTNAFSKLEKASNVLIGRGSRTQTCDLSVPNRARYQLRHTPENDYLF
jgi:site-specific DNA recombinase